ncbi:hypothetical protein MBM_03611 [Drepanopeziza brunnea f. sp. 'multigermtubi' MB_m1]|uniref:Zn(2)-C6 fungal-type domain-containing protein n=1 Tax=Marssonina brunnea f. sp. multigermtubi (strain MB_m1) TaxID=1072389 RepID=K1XYD6_MARBU|nr:uncharacterized protein MBM_03611 [Drepanopeziza brunnea f. sp. 'multigermtubi' MB_m1]EKD17839.1 hypothetical protein MBM_03611 [Drepanopeziza brunnea f. sp. 'multigermtubi' MB_m1]
MGKRASTTVAPAENDDDDGNGMQVRNDRNDARDKGKGKMKMGMEDEMHVSASGVMRRLSTPRALIPAKMKKNGSTNTAAIAAAVEGSGGKHKKVDASAYNNKNNEPRASTQLTHAQKLTHTGKASGEVVFQDGFGVDIGGEAGGEAGSDRGSGLAGPRQRSRLEGDVASANAASSSRSRSKGWKAGEMEESNIEPSLSHASKRISNLAASDTAASTEGAKKSKFTPKPTNEAKLPARALNRNSGAKASAQEPLLPGQRGMDSSPAQAKPETGKGSKAEAQSNRKSNVASSPPSTNKQTSSGKASTPSIGDVISALLESPQSRVPAKRKSDFASSKVPRVKKQAMRATATPDVEVEDGESTPSTPISGEMVPDMGISRSASDVQAQAQAQAPLQSRSASSTASVTATAPTSTITANTAPDGSRPCDECRKKKTACNRLQPCSSCVRSSLACTYVNPPILGRSKLGSGSGTGSGRGRGSGRKSNSGRRRGIVGGGDGGSGGDSSGSASLAPPVPPSHVRPSALPARPSHVSSSAEAAGARNILDATFTPPASNTTNSNTIQQHPSTSPLNIDPKLIKKTVLDMDSLLPSLPDPAESSTTAVSHQVAQSTSSGHPNEQSGSRAVEPTSSAPAPSTFSQAAGLDTRIPPTSSSSSRTASISMTDYTNVDFGVIATGLLDGTISVPEVTRFAPGLFQEGRVAHDEIQRILQSRPTSETNPQFQIGPALGTPQRGQQAPPPIKATESAHTPRLVNPSHPAQRMISNVIANGPKFGTFGPPVLPRHPASFYADTAPTPAPVPSHHAPPAAPRLMPPAETDKAPRRRPAARPKVSSQVQKLKKPTIDPKFTLKRATPSGSPLGPISCRDVDKFIHYLIIMNEIPFPETFNWDECDDGTTKILRKWQDVYSSITRFDRYSASNGDDIGRLIAARAIDEKKEFILPAIKVYMESMANLAYEEIKKAPEKDFLGHKYDWDDSSADPGPGLNWRHVCLLEQAFFLSAKEGIEAIVQFNKNNPVPHGQGAEQVTAMKKYLKSLKPPGDTAAGPSGGSGNMFEGASNAIETPPSPPHFCGFGYFVGKKKTGERARVPSKEEVAVSLGYEIDYDMFGVGNNRAEKIVAESPPPRQRFDGDFFEFPPSFEEGLLNRNNPDGRDSVVERDSPFVPGGVDAMLFDAARVDEDLDFSQFLHMDRFD